MNSLRESILSPEAIARSRRELVEAIANGEAHMHFMVMSSGRWVVITPRAPTPLCGTDRCIPLFMR